MQVLKTIITDKDGNGEQRGLYIVLIPPPPLHSLALPHAAYEVEIFSEIDGQLMPKACAPKVCENWLFAGALDCVLFVVAIKQYVNRCVNRGMTNEWVN